MRRKKRKEIKILNLILSILLLFSENYDSKKINNIFIMHLRYFQLNFEFDKLYELFVIYLKIIYKMYKLSYFTFQEHN
jgi:hypothetical protein